jgi:tRNA pseudouridine55 synthase
VVENRLDGLLVIDKPAGITSRDAVDRAQRWWPHGTRIGHTGTLDPLATGVLVLCLGNATRLTEYVQRMPKTYRAGIVLGARSDTDDADGNITPSPPFAPPTQSKVRDAAKTLLGAIEQVPPAFSAAKIAGRRAYNLARRGQPVELAARTVDVYAIELLRYEFPLLEIEVRCGKGTYVRALARDLGERLGSGGYIQSLRRTRVGGFDVADALSLNADAATARGALLPPAQAVVDLPRLSVAGDAAARLRRGQSLPLPPLDADATEVALVDERGELIAVGMVDRPHQCIRPGKVLAIASGQ